MSVRSFRRRLRPAAILAALLASPLAHAAEALTWQEANKRSAELIREHGPSDEAARLALQAFTLYESQNPDYNARSHAQLLLNAVDARERTSGAGDGLRDLERGIARIARRAGPDEPVLLELWQEALRIGKRHGSRRLDAYHAQAARLADQIWGVDDPRAVVEHLFWVHDERATHGYGWAKRKLEGARERAARSGEDSELVSRIDLELAKLELELERPRAAIPRYRALIERLERISDPEQALILQTAYAQLEYAHEKRGDTEAARDIRDRRNRQLVSSPQLVPTARVQPHYPASAARWRTEGWVELVITVAPDGTVAKAVVAEAEPAGIFDDAALQAVRKWKFKPKVVDGVPVEQAGRQRLEFRMQR